MSVNTEVVWFRPPNGGDIHAVPMKQILEKGFEYEARSVCGKKKTVLWMRTNMKQGRCEKCEKVLNSSHG